MLTFNSEDGIKIFGYLLFIALGFYSIIFNARISKKAINFHLFLLREPHAYKIHSIFLVFISILGIGIGSSILIMNHNDFFMGCIWIIGGIITLILNKKIVNFTISNNRKYYTNPSTITQIRIAYIIIGIIFILLSIGFIYKQIS